MTWLRSLDLSPQMIWSHKGLACTGGSEDCLGVRGRVGGSDATSCNTDLQWAVLVQAKDIKSLK